VNGTGGSNIITIVVLDGQKKEVESNFEGASYLKKAIGIPSSSMEKQKKGD